MARALALTAGFSIEPNSLGAYADRNLVLTIVALLALAGNILSPLILRATIATVYYCSPLASWRRVYARHLLLNGRRLYAGLFSQQQTTLLSVTQLALFALQLTVHHASTPSARHETQHAAYMAVQTRHAGFAVVDLTEYESIVLILFNLCMVLAPGMRAPALCHSRLIHAPLLQLTLTGSPIRALV